MVAATILAIEDDNGARAALGALLLAHGHRAALAADGNEALNLLASHPRPTLILLDMMVPNVDGWEFLALRRIDLELDLIPVVIMTGLSIASKEWARSLGAVALLRKPIDPAELLELVQMHGDGHSGVG